MVRDNVISMNTQKYMSRDGGEILKETRDKMAYSIELLSTAMSSKDIKVEPVRVQEVFVFEGYPTVERIIYSGSETVVIWKDKTKTIVSCGKGEVFDEFDGFTAALAKKIYGSSSAVKREIRAKRQEDKARAEKTVKEGTANGIL